MKKIIVSMLLLLSLFLITGCNNKNKISDITKKLGDRIEIRLINNQTEEEYLGIFTKIIFLKRKVVYL